MLIAGNWKMNTDVPTGESLAAAVAGGASEAGDALDGVGLAVCPPYVHLPAVRDALAGSPVALGAQNMHAEESGAYTGEISASMLTSVGCTYVILGHSERRQYYGETDAGVNEKVQRAHAHGLVPIVCVGETLDQRKAGDAQQVVRAQLTGALDDVSLDASDALVVAYEPVWAIGTGETATPEQAQSMHAYIREVLDGMYGDAGAGVDILYGGSMKPHNAAELLSQDDVDGGLIGGASLKAESFLAIAHHAADV